MSALSAIRPRQARTRTRNESLIVVTEDGLTRRHETAKDSQTAIHSALCASAALCETLLDHPSSFISRQFPPTDRPEPVELSRETNRLAVSYEYPTPALLATGQ